MRLLLLAVLLSLLVQPAPCGVQLRATKNLDVFVRPAIFMWAFKGRLHMGLKHGTCLLGMPLTLVLHAPARLLCLQHRANKWRHRRQTPQSICKGKLGPVRET